MYYPVLITEHLQVTVNIKAENAEEAVRLAAEAWKNADYILDAEQFTGVEISAIEDDGQRTMLHRDKNGNEYSEKMKINMDLHRGCNRSE